MPRISICATCYNHERFIPAFVESVLAQTCSDWELNVVDDCSTDGSFELLREYAARDARIHVARNDRNRHVCYSGNRAVSMAHADLITLISCDDILLPEKLSADIATLEASPSAAAVYTELDGFSSDNPMRQRFPLPMPFSRPTMLRTELFEKNVLPAPGLTLRAEAWKSLGGYHPFLRMTQDYDLHLKILERYEVLKSDCPTVAYRLHENNLSRKTEDQKHSCVNEMFWFLSRHYLSGIADVSLLKAVLPEFADYGEPVSESIPYFLARHAFDRGGSATIRMAGWLALLQYMEDARNRQLVEDQCGFSAKDLMRMADWPSLAAANELARVKDDLCQTKDSTSYNLGLALTWPLRKVYRSFVKRE